MNRIEMLFRTLAAVLAVVGTCATVEAQTDRIYASDVASLQVVADDNWLSMPVMQLGSGSVMNIAFDHLTHEYHRYAYRLEHCEADWTPSSQLLPSDFCRGFADGNTIDDAEESINTTVLYTHYRLQIPNERCEPTLSGNYRLSVYDDNSGDTVLVAHFMIVEPAVGISLAATTNTDADINGRHQQVEMELNYGTLRVSNHRSEIKTVVLQNGCWKGAVLDATPQYVMHDGLKWSHNRAFIFDGGNEYRKFETLDPSHATMGLESVGWDGARYHAYVWPDEPCPNYVYDEDANGYFYIRNSDNVENDTSSDYILTHFTLNVDRQPGDVVLSAKWTTGAGADSYRMEYDELRRCYTATLSLKQGYYSYRYLLRRSDGTLTGLPSEGNFYQTENQYQALVYYHAVGARCDRLVGYRAIMLK